MTDHDPEPQPDDTPPSDVSFVAQPDAPATPEGAQTTGDGTTMDASDPTAATSDPIADLVDPEVDGDPGQLRAELTAAEQQRDEYLDDVRRARAEFENYRRRTTREAAAARDLGKADVTGALLEVLDDLDRTLEAAESSQDETLTKAIALVADKLTRTLAGQGLERLDATGVPFDPEVHEAVQQVPAEEPTDEPQVAQILRPGYRLGDRTLRAAMVVVAG